MSKKLDEALKSVRDYITTVERGLSTEDYEEFVDQIGSDFDGKWDGIQCDRRERGED